MGSQQYPTDYNRREFLRRAGLTGFLVLTPSALLKACGVAETDPAAEETPSGTPDAGESVQLGFVGWEGYDGTPAAAFPAFAAWREENGVTLSSTYIADNPEMLTKIQSSPAGTYDLTTPYHGDVPIMVGAGALEPINTSDLANWSAIPEYFRNQDFLLGEDGSVVAVPFTFSHNVALYNADNVEPLQSYSQILEDGFQGRFAISASIQQFVWIAQYLGLGNPYPTLLTRDELAQCQPIAREMYAKARTVTDNFGDLLPLLVGNEVDYAWEGTADQVAAGQAEGANIQMFVPEEGARVFVDCYSIPAGSDNADVAHAWIDAALSPEVQAELAQVYGGAAVNLDAVPLLPDDLRSRFDYENLEDMFERLPILPPIPVESDEFTTYDEWVQAHQEVL